MYMSTKSAKSPSHSLFTFTFLVLLERARATLRSLAGHFWLTGHRLGTSDVNYIIYYVVILLICQKFDEKQ